LKWRPKGGADPLTDLTSKPGAQEAVVTVAIPPTSESLDR